MTTTQKRTADSPLSSCARPSGALAILLGLLLALLTPQVWGDNTITIMDAVADPASVVSVPVMASHDLEIHGFSLAMQLPPGVTLSGIDYESTAVAAALAGGDPEFSEIRQSGSDATVGVIFSLMPTTVVAIPATPLVPGNVIARLELTLGPSVIPGNYALSLVDGLGTPPVSNAFTSAGQSVIPALSSGAFTINNPFEFRVRPVQANPGDSVDVIFECDNQAALDGYIVSVLYDNSSLTRVSLFSGVASCVNPVDYSALIDCLDLDAALAAETIESVTVVEQDNAVPGRDFISIGVVMDFCPPFTGHFLPAGNTQSILRMRFNVSPAAVLGNSAQFSFTNDFPMANPIENLAIFGSGSGITPIMTDGAVEFGVTPPVGVLFRRGDAGGDGAVGLPDAITILNFLFLGAATPACIDAIDCNDDGSFGLTDVISLLNFLFGGGCPLPAPGDSCGIDVTDSDSLDCVSYPNCP